MLLSTSNTPAQSCSSRSSERLLPHKHRAKPHYNEGCLAPYGPTRPDSPAELFSLEAAVSVSQNPVARPSPFSPLRHGIYRAVWAANLITNFGGLIQSVGAA